MNQRDKQALEFINMKKMISTAELCETFGYSESTARRLLQRLSDRGLIQRYHGGGVSNQYAKEQNGVHERVEHRLKEKERIAKYAAELINPGDTVILLGGTTVHKMCKYLRGMKITVITNSMLVFDELKNNSRVGLILLGGIYDHHEMEVRGGITNSNLQLLRADSLFMGASTFHPQIGFLSMDIDAVELYHLCMEAVNNTYILSDSSKLSKDGAAVMATCQKTDCFITDTGLPDEMAMEFEQKEVKVVRV